MTTLLYAIVDRAAGERWGTGAPLPPGVAAAPVRLIEMDGLAAAVSTIAASEVMPTLPRASCVREGGRGPARRAQRRPNALRLPV